MNIFKSPNQRVRDVAKKIVDGLRDGTIVPDEPLATLDDKVPCIFTIQRPPNGIEAQHLEGNMSNVPTREFLEELREMARRYGWSGDYVVVEEFVRDLYGEAGLEPGDLEPYDKS